MRTDAGHPGKSPAPTFLAGDNNFKGMKRGVV